MKFAVFATGYKGFMFLKKLECVPEFIVTYDNKERRDALHYKKIIEWCNQNQIPLYRRSEINGLNDKINFVSKVLVVGWQFYIKHHLDKIVVFHDSYLPERRGFSPTLSALLDRSPYVGASCFSPENTLAMGPDYGKVYYRKKKKISYPIKLQTAFDHVVGMYVEMAHSLLRENPTPKMINYDNSSFSMWRNEKDLRIDWSDTASQIQQKIFALGYPYMGATAVYEENIIHLEDAIEVNDIDLMNRDDHHGKVWKIEDGNPFVVCREGIIKICKAKTSDNQVVLFNKIRRRFS